jgi:hypothetical protein
VAGHAAATARQLGDLFAHGELRIKMTVLKDDGFPR